jgi:PadR family transcriptional regulator PadR
MVFTAGSALLDAVVLSVVSQEGTYGYKITQDVRKIMEVSESTLYPVLRRLQKDNYLETYDMEYQGRNRRYYKITANGMILLDKYRREWLEFRNGVNEILLGEK